jgi:N-acyl-D-aspartate/D-glutamate deacylase
VFVGDARAAKVTAARTIDATGLIVAPGFIDPHTHTQSDLSNPAKRANLDYIMQGVTTVVTNNDGGGPVGIGALLARWDSGGIGTNAMLYVPQGSVRGQVMGMSDKPPTAAQLQQMKALVERGMREGAFGLSTGLYYAPGSYSSTDEVIELAKVAAAHGGIYDTHQRDESSYTIGLLASTREVLRIGREAHIPVHFSHIKALGAARGPYRRRMPVSLRCLGYEPRLRAAPAVGGSGRARLAPRAHRFAGHAREARRGDARQPPPARRRRGDAGYLDGPRRSHREAAGRDCRRARH